ncbi:MAG: hypothetical protein Q9227_000838 [Pyrenula ochraceoflavens]
MAPSRSLLTAICFHLLAFVAASRLVQHDASFVPDYVLRATAQNIPINCETRYSVIVNGTSPGPAITLQEGVTYWIRVFNDMTDQNLTMHWHGLSQRAAPFSDGTPQASQWPIPPLHYFDYEVRPEKGDAGTYFYHSHVGFQAVSAQGPLIVEDAETPPYDYADERTILLGDFYRRTDVNVTTGLLANPFVWSGETNGIVVNSQTGTSGANATDPSCAPHIINVDPGKTYRLRFIGGTAISLVTLGIEGHDELPIIEADGQYTQEYTTDHLQVASGSRFSVLFQTKTAQEIQTSGKSQYWMQLENRERPANVTSYAILSYNLPDSAQNTTTPNIPSKKPLTLPSKVYDWLEYSLQPLDPTLDPFPPSSSVTRRVYITNVQLSAGTLQWQANGDIWQTSRVPSPYLVDIYARGQSAIPNYAAALANNGWDPSSLAFPAHINETLEIIWQNDNGYSGGWDIHPFHAHGGHYWDLGSGNGTYDPAANDAKIASLNYTPVKRDTTMLYRYATAGEPNTTAGWRAWRIKVRYPGVWMLHCHILQHMIMGMQTAWVFGDAADILADVPRPEVQGYLTYGGDVYGNESHAPRVVHFHDK